MGGGVIVLSQLQDEDWEEDGGGGDIGDGMSGRRSCSTSAADPQMTVEAGHKHSSPVWEAMCHPSEQAVADSRRDGGRDACRAYF